MTDPLDALRDPAPGETPDPVFAAALRLRIEQALDRSNSPRRVIPFDAASIDPDELTADEIARLREQQEATEIFEFALEIDPADFDRELRRPIGEIERRQFEERMEAQMPTPTTTPIRIQQLSPYLAVADGRRAIDFYVDAFGAELIGEPVIMPDGKLGHASLQIGPVRVFLAEEFPEMNLIAPTRAGGVSVTLHLSLVSAAEVDAAAARAVAVGATLERPVADGPYGRAGVIIDPAGHRWFLLHEPESRA